MEYKRSCGMNYNSGFRSGAKPKWAVTTVNRILTNELYTGTMVQGKNRKINYKVKECRPVAEENWIRVEKTHEAIIAEEVFQYVQSLMELDTRTAPEEESVYIFRDFAMWRLWAEHGKEKYNKKWKTVLLLSLFYI